MADYSFPGVYIQEFTPGAPIEGVGTATAAFLGPSSSGPLNELTKVTSWDAFVKTFGDAPLEGRFLWYAVRGFFENNGRVCYIGRVSSGAFDSLVLKDRTGKEAIRLQARVPGKLAEPIEVVVREAHAVAAKLFRPTANVKAANNTTIEVDANAVGNAAKFLPGNFVVISEGSKSDGVTVLRVEGALVRLTAPLSQSYGNGAKLRLADPKAQETDTIRVEDGAKLAAGSVIRVSQGPTVVTQTVKSVAAERISPSLVTYRVTLTKALTESFDLKTDVKVVSQEFEIKVSKGTYTETYVDLAMDPGHPRYYATVVNSDENGKLIAAAVEPPSTSAAPDNRPADLVATALAGGKDDDPATLETHHYKALLARLASVDDVNIVAIPDCNDADVQQAMIAHCENMQDRFAILDSRRGLPLFGGGSVEEQRRGVDSELGYAALYYPWLFVSPAKGSIPVLVPPSGHVAGVYARTDGKKGVHKAPAGEDAVLNGVLGVERTMSDIDQGQLNQQGINVVRVFKGGGRAVVWGARTTATNPNSNWRYVSIRRLFLFLEESIDEGIRWAIFEPNNLALWQKLKRTITAFLTTQWRAGALFGAKPEDAFYVRIDEVLNPFSEQALGRLHLEIGVRPAYPAEFIIVRIGIWEGGSERTET